MRGTHGLVRVRERIEAVALMLAPMAECPTEVIQKVIDDAVISGTSPNLLGRIPGQYHPFSQQSPKVDLADVNMPFGRYANPASSDGLQPGFLRNPVYSQPLILELPAWQGMMPPYPMPPQGAPPPLPENPFVMVKSYPVEVELTAPHEHFGSASLEFSHIAVQNQFSVPTQSLLFKPLMAVAMSVRRRLVTICGREMSDPEWLSFYSNCAARISSRVLKLISRLYVAAAQGWVDRCHDLILELAEGGLVTGSETRLAVPVKIDTASGNILTWNDLVGEMGSAIIHLMGNIEPPPAPRININQAIDE